MPKIFGKRKHSAPSPPFLEKWQAFLGALVGACGAVLVSYFVTYHLIEKPKHEIELTRMQLEAATLLQKLAPKVAASCVVVQQMDFRFPYHECKFKNLGEYPITVTVTPGVAYFADEALISESSAGDMHVEVYERGRGFSKTSTLRLGVGQEQALDLVLDHYRKSEKHRTIYPFFMSDFEVAALPEQTVIAMYKNIFPDSGKEIADIAKFKSVSRIQFTPLDKTHTARDIRGLQQ